MTRICFLVDSIFTVGGVQRVTAVIAKQLAKDCEVSIVTFDGPETANVSFYGLDDAAIRFRFFSYPRVEGWKRKLCKLYSGLYLKSRSQSSWMSDLYARSSFPRAMRKALADELKQGNYDVIVGVHAPLAARLATLRPYLPCVKLIGWIHNSFEALFGSTSFYIGPERKRHYVYQFRKLDETVLLCQHDAESYAMYDASFRPTVIYNPLTLVPGCPSEGTSRRFLAVGRFSHQHKGFDLLIDAFASFAKTDKEWALDIVGEGPEEKLYRSKIAAYGLEQRVVLHPFTNHIQDYYSQAQVYVLSSRWEGFGLVLVEAMAHGLPVVSSDLPTSKEIMGDFGIYFRNGCVEDLAEKLHEATLIEWSEKSVEAVSIAHRFNVDSITEQWKQLLLK